MMEGAGPSDDYIDPSDTALLNRAKNSIMKIFEENNGQPVSYFHVVLDPDSFSKSVENMYIVSLIENPGFEIKNDKETGLPILHLCTENVEDSDEASGTQEGSKSFMVSINMKTYEKLLKVLKIKSKAKPSTETN